MKTVAPIQEAGYMPTKPRIGAVDQRLDSQALAHQDALGELREAVKAKNDLIVALAKLQSDLVSARAASPAYEVDAAEWNALVLTCARVNDALNAAGKYLGAAMAETLALRDEPSIKRARQQTRRDNEERRQRERRAERRWMPSQVAV